MFNLSLEQGTFPNHLKIAKVIPLFKSGDNTLISNYRPVSLLPLFSKILEKIVVNRLMDFINQNQILYKYQFGFRKKHNTNLALTVLVDKILSALESGEVVLGVFLDFSKAFDMVNHTVLLQTLYKYGIRGMAHSWFTCYLSNRKQFVSYNNTHSEYKTIQCGVPQGSIIGPILFLLYINDMVNASDVLFPILFADDSNVFINGKNPANLADNMNKELEKLVEWVNTNKLLLNINKTHFMFFSLTKRRVITDCVIMIKQDIISRVYSTKFLGVIIDSQLKWNEHIQYIKAKISKGLGIISKVRKVLQKSTLITLYYSFIYPYLTYCIEVWGSAGITLLSSLFRLQKRAIRIITSSSYKAHTHDLFVSLEMLTIEKIYEYCIGMFMYKVKHEMLPNIVYDIFKNRTVHKYSTRQHECLYLPVCKTTAFAKTIRFKGVNIWNKLLTNIDPYCSISTFKYRLKKQFSSN